MKLQGKVIIVTGASKGLGAAIAARCAREGAHVVCASLPGPELGRVAEKIRGAKGQALAVECDVAKMDDLRRLVAETLKAFGRIDGLVNNAGVNFVKPFLDVTEADWNHVLDVDLKGAFFLSQLAARQMLAQSPAGGSIVQIASVHTMASVAGASPYDAAKHGVVGFSKAAAVELARQGVRVNILSPGLCRTEIWNAIVDAAPSEKEALDYWRANIPAGRLVEPDEIAACCVFLLGDDSAAVTGSNLMADLGMTSLLVSAEPYRSKAIS